jgi:hypothetical protein
MDFGIVPIAPGVTVVTRGTDEYHGSYLIGSVLLIGCFRVAVQVQECLWGRLSPGAVRYKKLYLGQNALRVPVAPGPLGRGGSSVGLLADGRAARGQPKMR